LNKEKLNDNIVINLKGPSGPLFKLG